MEFSQKAFPHIIKATYSLFNIPKNIYVSVPYIDF